MSATPPAAKVCGDCRRLLSARCFWPERRRRDGLQRRCKDCARARQGRKARPFRGPNAHGDWRCTRCAQWLPRDAFRTQRGRRTPHVHCRPCSNAERREHYALCDRPNPARRAFHAARNRAYWHGVVKPAHDRARAERTAIAQRLLARLRAAGWRAKDIAAAVGVTDGALWVWQAGKSAPRADRLDRLAALAERVETEATR